MTREDARKFLFTLEAYMNDTAHEGDIEHDISRVIELLSSERESCAKIADEYEVWAADNYDARNIAQQIRSGNA